MIMHQQPGQILIRLEQGPKVVLGDGFGDDLAGYLTRHRTVWKVRLEIMEPLCLRIQAFLRTVLHLIDHADIFLLSSWNFELVGRAHLEREIIIAHQPYLVIATRQRADASRLDRSF